MFSIDVSAYTRATCLPEILVRMMMMVVVSEHNLAHFALCLSFSVQHYRWCCAGKGTHRF
jgi:hypothetical protein